MLYRTRATVSKRYARVLAGRVRYSRLKEAAPGESTYAYSIVLGLGGRLGEQILELVRTKAGWVRLQFACGRREILGKGWKRTVGLGGNCAHHTGRW